MINHPCCFLIPRAAVAATKTEKLDIASDHIKQCLALCKKQGEAAAKDAAACHQQARVIEGARKRLEGREARHREREAIQDHVKAMSKSRGLKIGPAEYARQHEYPHTKPSHVDGEWCWPILIVYVTRDDLASQSDYLQSVAESVSLSEIVSTVLDPEHPPPWDVDRLYTQVPALEVKVRKQARSEVEYENDADDGWRVREDEEWITLPLDLTIRQLVERDDYVIPSFPVLHIVPRGWHV